MEAQTTTAPATVNGFDTTALGGLVEVLKQHPEGGRVTFLSTTAWEDGARVRTQVSGYEIDGQMHHQNERRFEVVGDEPSEFGAADTAPAPPEMLMHAVANCILATTNAYAALQDVRLTRLEATVESDVDLHGMFGLDADVRPGLNALRIRVAIAGDADEAALRELAALGFKFSLSRGRRTLPHDAPGRRLHERRLHGGRLRSFSSPGPWKINYVNEEDDPHLSD